MELCSNQSSDPKARVGHGPAGSVHFHPCEADAVEQRRDRGAGVAPCGVENPIGQGGLLQLRLSLGAGLRFKILIDRRQQTRYPAEDARVVIVEGGDEYFTWMERWSAPSIRTSSGFNLLRSMPAMD
jgi:hypothetical protein